jgi:type IV secretion system protein VirB5
LSLAVRNWQLAFAVMSTIAVLLTFGIIRSAMQTKVQPFVVETCNNVPSNIEQFIINARTIISDPQAEKTLLNKVYAYSADNTLTFLRDYYEKNNPLVLSTQYTILVSNINPMKLSPNTWQITWEETKQNTSGGLMEKSRWMAMLTYRMGDVNPKFITDNPFGIYVTEVSWSQVPNE